jgi:DNA-binding transcriptional ArsR family regulator
VAILDEAAIVAAVLPPLRRRLVGCLHEEPDSASGLARKLGLSRQKANYHLRALERSGLVELAEERRRRGFTERTFRPTARAYLVSPAVLGELAADPETVRDRHSSSTLIAAAAGVLRDVATLVRRARTARQRLATLTLRTDVRFRSPADRTAFAEELADTLARLASKYHDGSVGSRAFRFVVAGHPVITRKRKDARSKIDEKGEGR